MNAPRLPFIVLSAAALACPAALAGSDPYADVVIAYDPGANATPGYTDPSVALGQPERITGEGIFPGVVSIFNAPWRPEEIVSIGAGGSLVLQFNEPVTDDPNNPFGIDLLIFGNAFFVDANFDGTVSDPAGIFADGGTVELSQDGETWCLADVEADGLFPTVGYSDVIDPYAADAGTHPANFTRPVNPDHDLTAFSGLNNDACLRLYQGSGGGVGVDLASCGLDSAQYIRIAAPADAKDGPEIDAVADVAPRLPGDTNADRIVDVIDMLDVLGAWGDAHPAGWHADFNDDGLVDLVDLLTVLNNWS